MRIWLPFVVAYVGFLLIKALAFDELDPQQWTSLGILGIATSGNDVLGVSWSLDIELQFYLLVPLLWTLCQSLDSAIQRPDPIIALVAIPLTVLGWGLGFVFGVWTVLAYLPGFVAGLLIWHTGWRPSGRLASLSVALFLAAGLATWLLPEARAYLQKDMPNALPEDWFGMAWMALLIPFIAFNVRQLSDRLDQHLGNFSYALYVTHWPVIWIVGRSIELTGPAPKLLALTAVALVAVAFYFAVDRNAERLRQAMLAWRMRRFSEDAARDPVLTR
jgi:peptidoglycan/LPS O-acetylase OafA/YrhL